MPRKKRAVIIEDADDEKPESDITAEEEAELEQKYQTEEWLTEFQERFSDKPVKILVEKLDAGGEWGICHKYPLQGFDPESVKNEYGGGKYRATLFGANGRFVRGGRNFFQFAEILPKPPEIPVKANPLEDPVVVMMLKSMESQNHTMLELTKSIIGAQAGKAGGMGEALEVIKSLNGMTPKDKPFDSLKDMLGSLKLLKEVTGDDGEEKGGLLSDVKDFLEIWPTVKDQLGQIKFPAPAQMTPQVPAALPSITVMGVEPERKEMDPLSKKIIELVPRFVGGARANAPILDWARYLLEVLDAEVMPVLLPVLKEKYKPLVNDESDVYDILLKYAKDPAERNTIFAQIPPLAAHKDWVNKVIDEAVRLEEIPEPPTGENVILETVAANGKDSHTEV